MSDTILIGNAAGTCKTLEHVSRLARSAVDIITVGSITVKPRPGHPGDNHYRDEHGRSINSLGLPNPGLEYYRKHLPEMIEMTGSADKRLSVSIAPIDEGDFEVLAGSCLAAGVPIIEINGGCPNVWKEGVQKRISSFDPKGLRRSLDTLVSMGWNSMTGPEVRFKLSPYSDPVLLGEVADTLRCYKVTLVASNTFPNAWMFREKNARPAIEFGKHLGGYAGSGMKGIALGQVAQFRELLPEHRIVGVGSIETGVDMWHFQLVGADEVQIGSAYYFTEDLHIYSNILTEYVYIIQTEERSPA